MHVSVNGVKRGDLVLVSLPKTRLRAITELNTAKAHNLTVLEETILPDFLYHTLVTTAALEVFYPLKQEDTQALTKLLQELLQTPLSIQEG